MPSFVQKCHFVLITLCNHFCILQFPDSNLRYLYLRSLSLFRHFSICKVAIFLVILGWYLIDAINRTYQCFPWIFNVILKARLQTRLILINGLIRDIHFCWRYGQCFHIDTDLLIHAIRLGIIILYCFACKGHGLFRRFQCLMNLSRFLSLFFIF